MACTASRAIAIAKAENGTKETGNNINKFAAYIDKNCPGFYNGKKQGVPYCDVFFDYCIIKDCDGDYKKAEKVLCQPANSAGAGCVYSYGYYKAAKRTGKTPKLGAQVFFGTSEKSLTHTGMVIAINGNKFTTEEGNSDNMVKQHTYTLGAKGSKVFGFGYPKYDPEPVEQKEDTATTPEPVEKPVADPKPEPVVPVKPAKSIDEYAKEVIDGKWGNNPQRAIKMKAAGIDYDAVQKRVNEMLKAGNSSSSGKKYTVDVSSDSYLNVRYGPNSDIKVGKLYRGDTVTVYEKKGIWGRIGTNRWVSMDYLK